jgi:hypothetical protein
MFGSATWHRGSEQCHLLSMHGSELKADMGAQKCELEFQKTKIAQLETKLEEKTQKHDKETCIILRL